jgi:glycosyltransferase involved in cell wall biosynthesis
MESYSALIPIRNGLRFLPKLKSYFDEIPNNFEIVIVDDHSSDGTSDFLKDWRRSDDRICLVEAHGEGVVKALNLGLSASQSTWIFRFDVDDAYRPERIPSQLSLVGQPNLVACFSDYEIVTEGGDSLGYIPSAIYSSATYLSLISSSRTPHPGAMLRREALTEIGGYQEQDLPCEDLGLWLRLKRIGDLYTIPESLLQWRMSPNSLTSANRSSMKDKRDQLIAEFFDFEFARKSFLNDSERIIESYAQQNYAVDRKLLYVLDFIKINNFRNELQLADIKFVSRYLAQLENFSGLTRLSFQRLKRDLYRHRQTKSNRS